MDRPYRGGMSRTLTFAVFAVLCASACVPNTDASDGEVDTSSSSTSATVGIAVSLFTSEGHEIPPAPEYQAGGISAGLVDDLEDLFRALEVGRLDSAALTAVAAHGDARTAWIFADVLRFTGRGSQSEGVIDAFESVTGVDVPRGEFGEAWMSAMDFVITWDLPAIPGYVDLKRRLYTTYEPGWAPFFADADSEIDWRLITWGGVYIDNRPLGSTTGCPRGCIPALDDPAVTNAAGGSWYADDSIVFGISLNGEARAYPKHQMETHEMVNDTLGGCRIGVPYCTLCGSAQAYLTDSVPNGQETPVLRTSGLLSRSNKVMYDLVTGSVFDTFTGEAISGPLREADVRLDQITVVVSTWGEWKAAYPHTTILAEDGGLGRSYSLDPLQGRDDAGPIFPTGAVDPRLAAHEKVIGVELPDGGVVAFPTIRAIEALESGEVVSFNGVALRLDGSGLRVLLEDGKEIAAHEAFWFAWSQFWPDTEIWLPE